MNDPMKALRDEVADLKSKLATQNEAGLSWDGHMVHGDKESIEAVRQALAALGGQGEELVVGGSRCYGDEYFREFRWRGVTFLAALDEEEAARIVLAGGAAPQQPEAQAGGEVVCSICEEVVEKIEAGYVPRGHGVYSKPFTTPPAKVPEGYVLAEVLRRVAADPQGLLVLARLAKAETGRLREQFDAMLAAAPAPKE